MNTQILTTKLFIPPPGAHSVSRPRLIERLNSGLPKKLTLVSAPAGSGKTTILSGWAAGCGLPVCWLSLDRGDNDLKRFLTYLIAALQTIRAEVGVEILELLQSPQTKWNESILTALLNEITVAIPDEFILILDDYHVVDALPVDQALTFLLEHMPPQMHMVIASREDPNLPLARLRARDQLTELRIGDLRFTLVEAEGFLKQAMGLNLTAVDIAALESRTEGWIAGLQLAAISIRGVREPGGFIRSFAGSHRFVMDYLIGEVLQQQPESIQTFLLRTSILDRLCGALCDAVCFGDTARCLNETVYPSASSTSSQETLEYLEHANLFIVPLDNERHWYRYHHLFAGFLRQRLRQSAGSSDRNGKNDTAELHRRASQWHEDNGLNIEAFHHAVEAKDIDRVERLLENGKIPVHYPGAVTAVLDWLGSLPTQMMDARPSLWVRYATFSLAVGQTTGVEERLNAAEAALQVTEPDDKTRDLVGIIAAARATLALSRYQADTIIAESRRALEHLRPDNLSFRFTAVWTQAFAYHLKGERAAASGAYSEALSISQTSGDIFSMILAKGGIGQVRELENQLYPAVETYQQILQLYGDHPQPIASEANLGLARIHYEWNDLDAAERYGLQSLHLAQQYDGVIDRYIASEVFLARLKLALGDVDGADAILDQAEKSVQQHNFVHRMPEVTAAKVLVWLRQGYVDKAAYLVQTDELPFCQARVRLAQGETSAALAILEPLRLQMEAKGWADERLKVMVLQAIVLHVHGEKNKALNLLGEVLASAKPGGFVRIFVDEGIPMTQLLSEASDQGIMPEYVNKLLAVFGTQWRLRGQNSEDVTAPPSTYSLIIEPLSRRENEILQLIAQGLSNYEISARLFLALDTVKGHNRRIYEKLQVQRRTEAVARARELGLL